MDDYELQERQITDALNRYKKNRDKELYRKISHELDMYLLLLDQTSADKQKYDWQAAQRKMLTQLKQQKELIVASPKKGEAETDPLNPNIGQQVTQQMKKELDEALKGVEKNIDKAIDVSNFIKIELEKQIDKLDEVYQQNKDFQARMKRAKDGLNVILRMAMTNKITRFFAMLLVLAIIGVSVVLILRSNGTIQ